MTQTSEAQTSEGLKRVRGTVLEYLGSKAGGSGSRKWTRHDFTLLFDNGNQVRSSVFGKFDSELVGQVIEFTAEYNAKYKNYSVKGEIEVVAGEEPAKIIEKLYETTVVPEVLFKKRGRKPNVGTNVPTTSAPTMSLPSCVVLQERSVTTDLESVREAAEATIVRDVAFASQTLGFAHRPFGNAADSSAIATLVQALQAVRATLFIEANKRERVADIKANR